MYLLSFLNCDSDSTTESYEYNKNKERTKIQQRNHTQKIKQEKPKKETPIPNREGRTFVYLPQLTRKGKP